MQQDFLEANGYESPVLVVFDTIVEQGFATSGGATIEDGKSDDWGEY